MTPARSRGHILVRSALVALAAGFAGVAGAVWVNPVDTAPEASAAEPAAAARPGSGLSPSAPAPLPPVEMLKETRARPLFSPDRKPAAASGAVATSGAAIGESEIELLGTLVSGNREQALLRVKQPASQEWLAVGAVAAGWRVVKITKDKVVIVAGAKHRELVLYPAAAPQKN